MLPGTFIHRPNNRPYIAAEPFIDKMKQSSCHQGRKLLLQYSIDVHFIIVDSPL